MKLLLAIVLTAFAVTGEARPRAWMQVSSPNELAYVINTTPECEYPKDRLEEIVVVNIRRAARVPVIYPIARADIIFFVELGCFRSGHEQQYVYDLDVDFGLDNGDIRVVYEDGDYDAYGLMDFEGIDDVVDHTSMRAVTDFVTANTYLEAEGAKKAPLPADPPTRR